MLELNKMQEEVWKPIKNWEGMYEVSSDGRVRSIRRIGSDGRIVKERIMRQSKTRGNYLTVMFKDNKTNRKKGIEYTDLSQSLLFQTLTIYHR